MSTEVDVKSILIKDGINNNDLDDTNNNIVNTVTLLEKLLKTNKNQSFSKTLVNTENNSCTMICQQPGEGNRKHYHPDWNEWWFILDGEWEFIIDGEKKIIRKNDLVFIPKNGGLITAIGNKPATRLAVSRYDVAHVYK